MKCCSCLENFHRKEVYVCHDCKAWYCPECLKDHTPCNEIIEEKVIAQKIDEIDDSMPGIWITKEPVAELLPFNFWDHVS